MGSPLRQMNTNGNTFRLSTAHHLLKESTQYRNRLFADTAFSIGPLPEAQDIAVLHANTILK